MGSNPTLTARYPDQATGFSLPVHLIPFGGIATGDGTIECPPTREIVMNVAGFEEALTSSMPVEIEPDFVVRVASLTGLTLLKLVAWSEGGRETDKTPSISTDCSSRIDPMSALRHE